MLQDGAVPPTAVEGESPAAVAAASGTPVVEGTSEVVKNVANAAKDAPPPWMQFLPFIAIGLFFYFILLRPQQAEQRRRKELLTTLKKRINEALTTLPEGVISCRTLKNIVLKGEAVTTQTWKRARQCALDENPQWKQLDQTLRRVA